MPIKTTAVKVGIAITDASNTIANDEYIDKDVELLPSTVIERTGIAIKQGQYITVIADGARVYAPNGVLFQEILQR